MSKNILIGTLMLLCVAALAQPATIDLISMARQAKWLNDRGTPLPFPGKPNDSRGFALLLRAQLEDGQSYTDVLQTHPRWAAQGTIEGRFQLTIPENSSLEAVVGFLQGASGSDGVTFEVLWKEGNQEVLLAQAAKRMDGRLTPLNANLANYGGHPGTIILRVKAGASSGQDWAVWKSIRIVPVAAAVGASQAKLRQPALRAVAPPAEVKPQQPGQPEERRRVEATLSADPASYSGPCPATINFRGRISVSAPGQVQYRFIRSDRATAPVQTLNFPQPGSQEVTTTWRIGRDYSGWVAIKVTSPLEVESEKANFEIKCGAAAEPSRIPAPQEKPEKPPGRIVAPPKIIERIPPGIEARKDIPIAQVPVQLQRRALNFLEDVRKTDLAPALKNARLGQVVHPFYRPDLPTVAYYEFEIDPGGYVLLSQGRHDYPVTTWNQRGKSVSQKLQEIAQRAGKQADKFYALSDFAFAAEDSTGELVAYLGSSLIKVVGMNASWMDENMPLNEAIAAPVRTTQGFQYDVPVSEKHPYQIAGWNSWGELKKGYAQEYKVFLDALRQEAQEEWADEEEAPRTGELLIPGETFCLPLLYDGAKLEVSASASRLLNVRRMSQNGKLPYLEITARDPKGLADNRGDVSINYPNGLSETIMFKVLSSPAAGSRSPGADAILDGGGWSEWEYWWAGGHEDQRLYYQVQVSCDVLSGCGWSGCGATAWGMLFGWVDHQAANGNPTWVANWGIYRRDGGTGDDADAPRDQDAGVDNMTKEISGSLNPLCVSPKSDGCFQGATAPRKMDEAFKYLKDRATAPLVLKTKWGTVGVPTKKLAERAIHWIKSNRTPVIIGTGHLSIAHYPLAYGFAERHKETWAGTTRYSRWLYINQGWGSEEDSKWVKARVWFVGTIIPTSAVGDFVRGDGFTAGDVDGGNAEIIYASRHNKVAVFDYSGAKEREWMINFQRFDGLAAGDVDGDGLEEIVHASRDNKITVYDCSGNIKNEFGIGEYKAFKGGVGDEYDWYYGDRLAVGDVDADGKDEIIHASRDNKITIYDGSGMKEGEFQADFERGDGFAAGDVDGDGRDEIIQGDRDNKIIIYDATGRRKYDPFEVNYEEGDEVTCGDVDGDGRDEIIHGDRGDRIVVYNYLGNKKGEFQVDFEREDGLTAADVDGDGKDEIIHADRHNKINIYDSTGRLKRMI